MAAEQSPPWRALAAELDAWGEAGRCATLWWRDDDACGLSPALRQLDALSRQFGVGVALAVIPQAAEPSLAALLAANPRLCAWQHGFAHRNHAAPGQRRCELGAERPLAAVLDELAAGRRCLEALLAGDFQAVLVPPWNRLNPALLPQLTTIGLAGLSAFGPRPWPAEQPLAQLNVQVDLIDWRGGRGYAGDERVLAQLVAHLRGRRLGTLDPSEASGVMSHHRDHDAGCWQLLERLLAFTLNHPHCRWIDPRSAFAH